MDLQRSVLIDPSLRVSGPPQFVETASYVDESPSVCVIETPTENLIERHLSQSRHFPHHVTLDQKRNASGPRPGLHLRHVRTVSGQDHDVCSGARKGYASQ
jgi:hypothetical protein